VERLVAIVIDATASVVALRVILMEDPGRRVVYDSGPGSDGAVGDLDLMEAPADHPLVKGPLERLPPDRCDKRRG
jgi:hypothetical protein